MRNFLLYAFLILVAFWYIRMLLEIWKLRKEEKSEWEQYWDEVFNNAKNQKL